MFTKTNTKNISEHNIRATMIRLFSLAVILVGVKAEDACSNTCPPAFGSDGSDLCEGDEAISSYPASLTSCWGAGVPSTADMFPSSAPDGPGFILVIANHYIGCNAGRREANVFSLTASTLHAAHPNVHFITSLKGGTVSSCQSWANTYASSWAASVSDTAVLNAQQPTYVFDDGYALRDAYFTPPYPHPSYVVIDHTGVVRHKFVGPCCGREDYFDCSDAEALTLDTTLSAHVEALLGELQATYPGGDSDCFLGAWSAWSDCGCASEADAGATRTRSRSVLQEAFGGGAACDTFALFETEACPCAAPVDCAYSEWSAWSGCTAACGASGRRFRSRTVAVPSAFNGTACDDSMLVEAASCEGAPTACAEQCVPRLGERLAASAVDLGPAAALAHPRGLAFSPLPGRHLGSFVDASGRGYPEEGSVAAGDEAWVADGHNHAVTIVTGLGTGAGASTEGRPDNGTAGALRRLDRGWYHYMVRSFGRSLVSSTKLQQCAQRGPCIYLGTRTI